MGFCWPRWRSLKALSSEGCCRMRCTSPKTAPATFQAASLLPGQASSPATRCSRCARRRQAPKVIHPSATCSSTWRRLMAARYGASHRCGRPGGHRVVQPAADRIRHTAPASATSSVPPAAGSLDALSDGSAGTAVCTFTSEQYSASGFAVEFDCGESVEANGVFVGNEAGGLTSLTLEYLGADGRWQWHSTFNGVPSGAVLLCDDPTLVFKLDNTGPARRGGGTRPRYLRAATSRPACRAAPTI